MILECHLQKWVEQIWKLKFLEWQEFLKALLNNLRLVGYHLINFSIF